MIWVKAILLGFLIGFSGTWALQHNVPTGSGGESAVFLAPSTPEAPRNSRFRSLLLMEGKPIHVPPPSRLPHPV